MKKKLLLKHLFLLFVLIVGSTSAWGQDDVYKTALFGSSYNPNNSNYTSSFEATNGGFTVTVTNFNNNNNGWTNSNGYGQIKCGRKNVESVASITTKAAVDKAITKVVVTIDAITADKVNSIKLYSSSNGSTWTENGSFTKATGAQSVSLTTPTTDLYYKVEFDCAAGSSNGLVTVSKVEYYYSVGSMPAVILSASSLDFGNVNINETKDLTFTVTPANLTSALTIACDNDKYEVTPTSIASTVTAETTITVTAKPTATTDDMDGIITISGGGLTAEKTVILTTNVVDPDAPGASADNPYTVAQARAAIDEGTGTQGVYAKGIVSAIPSVYNSSYSNITFNFVDATGDEAFLQAYRCTGNEVANVAIGDEVVVYGNLTKYNTTYEFASGCQLVSLTHPTTTTPVINADDVEIEYDATSGEIAYTISNPVDGVSLNATTTANWISNITVSDDKVTFTTTANESNADRTATFSLTYSGAVEKVVTVTQKHYVADYAELPFEFDGGRAAIENIAGLTQEGLGSDYNNSPKLKFDGTGDWLLLHFNERPGMLTFDIKGNSFSEGSFKVQTSTDGVTFTDLETYDDLGNIQAEEFNNLSENVRYIKWIYTEKVNGNVALGNIKLTKYVEPSNEPQIEVEDVEIAYNATSGEIPFTIVNPVDNPSPLGAFTSADWISDVDVVKEDATHYTVTFNTTTNIGDERTATFTINYNGVNKDVTVTQAAYDASLTPVPGHYLKVTSTEDITDGQYLIVYEGDVTHDAVALNGGLETLDAANNGIGVTIADNQIAATTVTRSAEFKIDVASGTLKSASGYFIGILSSNSNGLEQDTHYDVFTHEFSIDNDGNAVIKAQTYNDPMYLRYNNTANNLRFRYYKSGQQAVQLYKYVPEVVPATITEYKWATFSSDKDLDFTSLTDVEAYIVTGAEGSAILTEQVYTAKAGTGLLLYSETAGDFEIPIAVEGEGYTDRNKLIAVEEDNFEVGVPTAGTNYVLTVKDEKAVFAYINSTPAVLRKGQAYLNLDGAPSAPYLGFDGEGTTGINNVERGALNVEGCYTLDGRRVENPAKGVYIINGRKVVVK